MISDLSDTVEQSCPAAFLFVSGVRLAVRI